MSNNKGDCFCYVCCVVHNFYKSRGWQTWHGDLIIILHFWYPRMSFADVEAPICFALQYDYSAGVARKLLLRCHAPHIRVYGTLRIPLDTIVDLRMLERQLPSLPYLCSTYGVLPITLQYSQMMESSTRLIIRTNRLHNTLRLLSAWHSVQLVVLVLQGGLLTHCSFKRAAWWSCEEHDIASLSSMTSCLVLFLFQEK